MSAEILRAAADRLDELAGAASLGPWAADVRDDGRAWLDLRADTIGLHGYPATTAYIAAMHPEVGKALAAWLRGYASMCVTHHWRPSDEALTVARLILGGAS